jgi:hyaluronate lyase
VTLWIDHDADPADARYAYVQLPAASRTATEQFARRDVVEVLANTPAVQAARRRDLGLTMANFWVPGAPPVGGISVDRTASVVVSDRRGALSVAVSDPTQLLTGNVTVEVAVPARQYVGGDAKVSATGHGSSVSLTVDMTGSAGRSYVARFRR